MIFVSAPDVICHDAASNGFSAFSIGDPLQDAVPLLGDEFNVGSSPDPLLPYLTSMEEQECVHFICYCVFFFLSLCHYSFDIS
jgi:hypothetical protein